MNMVQSPDDDIQTALRIARELAAAGAPIFVAKADPNQTLGFRLPARWQMTTPDPSAIDAWEPGDALGMVTGVIADGLDVDPRHGGDETAAGLQAAGAWPTSYGRQETPSGGTHDLIAPLRIASKDNTAPGLDVKSGKVGPIADAGRGFLFVAPTVRASKETGELKPYRWVVEPNLEDVDGDDSGETVKQMVQAKRSTPKQASTVATGGFFDPQRSFTLDEARKYVDQFALAPLRSAPLGGINDALNDAAVVLSHFIPTFVDRDAAASALLAAISHTKYDGKTWKAEDHLHGLDKQDWKATLKPEPAEAEAVEALDAVDAMLARMLDRDGLDDIPDLKPLIDGLLDLDTPARLNGPSNSGKSFISLDMAGCVSQGIDFHGKATTQAKVVYIVAEGLSGIRKRVRAWEQHHGRKMTDVLFFPEPVQVNSSEWSVLIEACRRVGPGLIIVDTQARVTVGVDENSAKDTGEVVERIEQLRRATGACVLLVHHTGHEGTRARGSTAVLGAMNSELGVQKDGFIVTLKTTKQKDREFAPDMRFRLETVQPEGSFDTDTSAVLVSMDQPQEEVKGERYTAEDARVIYAMELYGEASVAQMVKAYGGDGGPFVKSKSENTARAAIMRAERRGVIRQTDGGTPKRPLYVLVPLEERMAIAEAARQD